MLSRHPMGSGGEAIRIGEMVRKHRQGFVVGLGLLYLLHLIRGVRWFETNTSSVADLLEILLLDHLVLL